MTQDNLNRHIVPFVVLFFCFSTVSDATIYGWGNLARLGQATQTFDYDPILLERRASGPGNVGGFIGIPVKTIVCSNEFIVLTSSGFVYRFGADAVGSELYGALEQVLTLRGGTTPIDTVADIACSSTRSTAIFALTNSGFLYSWGGSDSRPGVEGPRDVTTTSRAEIVRLNLPPGADGTVTKISVSDATSFVLLANGSFIPYGACGSWCLMAAPATFPSPLEPQGVVVSISGEIVVDLSVSGSYSMFCTASGRVYTAGSAMAPLMVDNVILESSNPLLVDFGVQSTPLICKQVIASQSASFVLMRDGSVWSAGSSPTNGLNDIQSTLPAKISFTTATGEPFIVSKLFVLAPERPQIYTLAAGTYGTKQTVYGWGQSLNLAYWIPRSEASISYPFEVKYIAQDIGETVSHCFGLSQMHQLALCTTQTGRIVVWSANMAQLPFETDFRLPQPGTNTTIPSKGDTRNILGPGREVVALFDEDPTNFGFLVLQLRNGLAYFASGLSDSVTVFISSPGEKQIKSVSVTPENAYTAVLTEDGLVHTTQYYSPNPQMKDWSLVNAFVDAGVQASQLVAFNRQNSTEFGWFTYGPANALTAENLIGFLVLSSNSELWWTKRAPVASWADGVDPLVANKVESSFLFDSPIPTIKKIVGKYDWFFAIDTNNETWTFGDNRDSCGCASNTTVQILDRASKVTGISNVEWIFPIVDYFSSFTSPIIQSMTTYDAKRGTVLVAPTQIKVCGWPELWPGLEALGLPPGTNATNPIISASFSALTGIVRLRNGQLWAVGRPESLTSLSWKRYDNQGSLKTRDATNFVALSGGGGAVGSTTSITPDPNRKIVQNLFEQGAPLTLYGTSLGESGDGQATQVIYYKVAYDNSISSTLCEVFTRTPTSMTVFPTTQPVGERSFEPGPLWFDVTVGDLTIQNVTVGFVVPPPQLAEPSSNDADLPMIAQNADTFPLFGTNLLTITRIELTPSGECRSISANASVILCTLSSDSLRDIPVGFVLSARVYVADQNYILPSQRIYMVAQPPSITASSSEIQLAASEITIKGDGFDPNASGNQVFLKVDQGMPSRCNVQNSTGTEIVCRVTNTSLLSVPGGIVTATVRAFYGNSDAAAIGTIARPATNTTTPSTPTAASNNERQQGANTDLIIGLVVTFVVVIIALIIVGFIMFRRYQRKNAGIKGSKQSIPQEMAAMFNIKSSDLEIVRKLGEGSFGAVYQCKWKNKMVALKKLMGSMMSSHVNDFFREATLMTSIPPHKNIVRIYGLCQEQSNFSLVRLWGTRIHSGNATRCLLIFWMQVMEYLRLGSLDSYISSQVFYDPEKGRWDPNLLYRIVIGICRGMAHLAKQGVVHRDLAARNVLLGDQCEPKISDFGMSRMVGADSQSGQTNSTIGPVRWMPPESLSQRTYSEKSDVWAYGVTLFEITTGRDPFGGDDLIKIALEVRDQQRNVLTNASDDIVSMIPKYILKTMQKCFEQDPADRPTFAELERIIAKGQPFGYTETKEDDGEIVDEPATAEAPADASAAKNKTNRSKSSKSVKNSEYSHPDSILQPAEEDTSTESPKKKQKQKEKKQEPSSPSSSMKSKKDTDHAKIIENHQSSQYGALPAKPDEENKSPATTSTSGSDSD